MVGLVLGFVPCHDPLNLPLPRVETFPKRHLHLSQVNDNYNWWLTSKGQGSQNKAHISSATPKLICFWKIFAHHIIGKEKCWFGMVKVWSCYLWFFTVIWSKYSASKVSLSMEVAMGPWGVVNEWGFKAKRCWEPFQRLPPGSDHHRPTSSWCPRQGSSSWSEERPEQIGLQLIENWKTQTNKYGKPLRSSGPLLQSVICWKRRTCWSRTCSK